MKILRITPTDNVAVALVGLTAGETFAVDGLKFTTLQAVEAGHKVALMPITKGEAVIKYGSPIGLALADIAPGNTVHTHNLKTSLGGLIEYSYNPQLATLPKREPSMFQGYRRPNGKVGVRNEVWIVPVVGCVNVTATYLQKQAETFADGVDGVYAFPHPYGCSQMSDDFENTRKALAGLINHPNAGAVLVLGLGCESVTIEGMKEVLGDYDPERVRFLVTQESADEYAEGVEILRELVDYAGSFRREPVPMGELIVGLVCGGSDGFSGITANPLVGCFTDRLIAEGGSAILTEVPEMFGAETVLMNRCRTSELFDDTVRLINNFKTYFMDAGQDIYENPSPGNKAGGISTLEEKSLGCIQKGGISDVVDVLDYGEQVTHKGLNLLTGPGNDLVATSNLVISDAQIVIFTTGRGTPFGGPVPTVKISSNTDLYERKPGWIDFNSGCLLDGTSMEACTDDLYAYIRALASGEILANNEIHNAREFTIFKTGVTL